MSLTADKGLGKRARREISDRLRAYYQAVIRMVEADSEAFFARVMSIAEQQNLQAAGQAESAQL